MQAKTLQSGQALLLVVIVLVISTTIGLSVATRSLTNIKNSSEEESSAKAFSAAEAGIERALSSSQSGSLESPLDLGSDSSIKKLTVGQVAGNEILINNGSFVSRGDGIDVWLAGRNADGSVNCNDAWNGDLNLFWGANDDFCSANPTTNTTPALEVVILSGLDTAPLSRHYFFDPCAARRNANNFTGTTASSWTDFANSVTISAVTNGLLMRIIPLYADAKIGVRGNNFPAQGTVIESVGSSGGAERKIVTFRGYPKLPSEFFPHMLFSPKNQ